MYQFEFKSSYLGEVYYEVWARGFPTRHLVWRHSVPEYEAQWADAATYSAIGYLRFESDPMTAVPADIVAAFNTWRAAKYERYYNEIKNNPNKYGDPPRYEPPVPVQAAVFNLGNKVWEPAP